MLQDAEVGLDDIGTMCAVEAEGIGKNAVGDGAGEAGGDFDVGQEECLGEDDTGGAATGIDEGEIGQRHGSAGMLIDDKGDAAMGREGIVLEGGLGIDEGDLPETTQIAFAKSMGGDAQELDHGAVFDAADDTSVCDAGLDVKAFACEVMEGVSGGEGVRIGVIVCEDEERGEAGAMFGEEGKKLACGEGRGEIG